MSPLLILAIGMALVVGGILFLRLHAFLALIVAALIVAALTDKEVVYAHVVRSEAVRVVEIGSLGHYALKASKNQKIIEGEVTVFRPHQESGILEPIGTGRLSYAPNDIQLKMTGARGVSITPALSIELNDRVIHHTQLAEAKSVSNQNIAVRVGTGFGGTCLKIGIMIAMASIIGKCLMKSGAAERIVMAIRDVLGEKNAPIAFIASGFTLGIPVFFETVFYLMMPLGKAMYMRTGRNYLLYVLTIIAGGTMAHSLVPPTPGPLFVAYELGVDIGLAIIVGTCIGLFTTAAGFCWAVFINRRMEIPLRESSDLTNEQLQAMADRKASDLPNLFGSILPILLPVILLAGGTIFTMQTSEMDVPPDWVVTLTPIISVLGNKDIALSIAAACALILLAKRPGMNRDKISESVQGAIADAGVIVLITAAGGAFGHVLRQTGISGTIEHMLPGVDSGLMLVGFLVCMVVRTAQGSSTVAMITAVGVVAPLVASQTLAYHPVYIAIAIGCGGKPISWMNDSAFWVISRMSGLTEGEMLKTNTIMGIIMAVTGLIVCLIGSRIFPMV